MRSCLQAYWFQITHTCLPFYQKTKAFYLTFITSWSSPASRARTCVGSSAHTTVLTCQRANGCREKKAKLWLCCGNTDMASTLTLRAVLRCPSTIAGAEVWGSALAIQTGLWADSCIQSRQATRVTFVHVCINVIFICMYVCDYQDVVSWLLLINSYEVS